MKKSSKNKFAGKKDEIPPNKLNRKGGPVNPTSSGRKKPLFKSCSCQLEGSRRPLSFLLNMLDPCFFSSGGIVKNRRTSNMTLKNMLRVSIDFLRLVFQAMYSLLDRKNIREIDHCNTYEPILVINGVTTRIDGLPNA